MSLLLFRKSVNTLQTNTQEPPLGRSKSAFQSYRDIGSRKKSVISQNNLLDHT